ncbi:MAG: hypothetical protein FJ010_05110 [Chloroflexi bacterium]|nr:hypothetical protein [Chloroflexota bacterium]
MAHLYERDHSEILLKVQAELLGLSRGSLYYEPVGPSAREIAIKHLIDETYTRYPFYGSRRMKVVAAPWTIASPRDFGVHSNMKKST